MISIFEYIKLKDIKGTKVSKKEIDTVVDIMTAVFIHVLRYKKYKQISASEKRMKSSELDYNDIVNILNFYFNYDFSEKDIKRGGTIRNVVATRQYEINKLLNYYKFEFVYKGESIELNGKDLFQQYKEMIYQSVDLY